MARRKPFMPLLLVIALEKALPFFSGDYFFLSKIKWVRIKAN